MKPTEIKDKVNDIVISQLEKGTLPREQSRNTMQYSGATGKPYRGINQLILQIIKQEKGYQSSVWPTFNVIKNLGGRVKPGEKGNLVVFNKSLMIKERQEDGTFKDKQIFFHKNDWVWNFDQTTITNVTGQEYTKAVTMEAIFENMSEQPIIIRGPNPCYKPKTDVIELPYMHEFKKPSKFYGVKAHEKIHRTGAYKRCNRKGIVEYDRYGSEQYGLEELIAQLGSQYLCTFAGVENTIDDTASYIEGRLKALKNDRDMIFKASAEAWKATEYILNGKQNLLENFDLQSEKELV